MSTPDTQRTPAPAPSTRTWAEVDCDVGRLEPERAGFLEQIEACRRDVAQWPEWMRATRTAPKWMEGWDD